MKNPGEDDDDDGNDRILTAMTRMIRVLNQHVSHDEPDKTLEDMEGTFLEK